MTWRLARSLETLRSQINALYPNRSKASDGSIGDEAHASRDSDHNPWVKDGAVGVVTAIDVTNDPAHGIASEALAEALRAGRDERIKYIISNRKICSGTGQDHTAWQWRPYTGKNPHNHHVHISVKADGVHYDNVRKWLLSLPAMPDATPQPAAPAPRPVLRKGAKGDDVRDLQRMLNVRVDGDFGEKTEAAVKAMQKAAGLHVDGIVGPYTWDALAGLA